MVKIENYNIEDLRKLYKSITLYKFTEMLKRQLELQETNIVEELDVVEDIFSNLKKTYKERKEIESAPNNIQYFLAIGREKVKLFYENSWLNGEKGALTVRKKNIKILYKLFEDLNLTEEINPESAKINNLRNLIKYYQLCNDVIFWCGSIYEFRYKEALIENETKTINDLEDSLNEFHINDESNKLNDMPTESEIYNFIWETLRFCNINEIDKLLKFKDVINKPIIDHRPAFNKKIFKYDKEGNLIATFINREDCIKKENIKKQALSHVLLGRRKTLNSFIYKEEE